MDLDVKVYLSDTQLLIWIATSNSHLTIGDCESSCIDHFNSAESVPHGTSTTLNKISNKK
jgi:hypothetical protein